MRRFLHLAIIVGCFTESWVGVGTMFDAETAVAQITSPNVNTSKLHDDNYVPERPWYYSPRVQQQLKLKDTHVNQMNDSYKDFRNWYNQELSRLDSNLPPDEQARRRTDLRNEFHTKFRKTREELVSDAELLDRYDQLHWQFQGYGAFHDPRVRQRLQLTDEQRDRLLNYENEAMNEHRSLREQYNLDRGSVAVRVAAMQAQTRARINAVLNEQQRRRWIEMMGTPYDFTGDEYYGSMSRALISTP